MTAFQLFIGVSALLLSGTALGQSGERGSIPPGQSKDGAAPSAGAIKGGSILPGESAGIPEKRCDELSGSLREDCLKQQRAAGAGPSAGEAKAPVPILEPSDTRRKSPERAD